MGKIVTTTTTKEDQSDANAVGRIESLSSTFSYYFDEEGISISISSTGPDISRYLNTKTVGAETETDIATQNTTGSDGNNNTSNSSIDIDINNDNNNSNDWNPNNLSSGDILRQTLSLYGTTFIVCLIVFCFVRVKYPKAYNLRNQNQQSSSSSSSSRRNSSNTTMMGTEQLGLLRTRISWFWNVLVVSDMELSDKCGMDALCLCRVIEWGIKLSSFGSVIGAILLMPVYATGGNGNSGVEQINTSNIYTDSGSVDGGGDSEQGQRFIATVIAAYLIFGYTMYTTLDEFAWFYSFRYDFLSKPIPRNYSIYVRNLSKEYMTRKSLQEYFSNFEDKGGENNDNHVYNNNNNNSSEAIGLLSTHKSPTNATNATTNSNFNPNTNTNTNTLKVWISLKIPNLQKLVGKRSSVLSKLEHAINVEDVLGQVPKIKVKQRNSNSISRGTREIEITLVDSLFDELKELNKEITLSIENLERRAEMENPYDYDPNDYQNPFIMVESGSSDDFDYDGDPLQQHQYREPVVQGKSSPLGTDTFFDSISLSSRSLQQQRGDQPTISTTRTASGSESNRKKKNKKERTPSSSPSASVSVSTFAPSPSSLGATITSTAFTTTVPKTIDEDNALVTANPDGTDDDYDDNNKKNDRDSNISSIKDRVSNLAKTSVNVVAVGNNQIGNGYVANNTIPNSNGIIDNVTSVVATTFNIPFVGRSGNDDVEPMTAGFVTFSTLKACQVAKQMIHSNDNVFGMEVFEAPGIDDINWKNVGKTHKELQFGLLTSCTLTTVLCLFWTVVISFIATLASVEGLIGVLPKIGNLLVKAPWLEMVLAQLAPILILVSNEILKIVLEVLSGLEGPVSGAEIQASTFSKLSAFMIIQTFFVSAVSGSLISQITAMVENPTMIVSLLADSLPNRSTYFIQILLVGTCISLSVELLRVSAIATAAVRLFVGPKLTEEERQTTWMGIRPFADPMEFQHAQILSSLVLYFIVFFVYATLAPITSIFIFICFLFMGAAYRHQFIFIYPTKPDSGGKLWVQFMRLIPVCILIAEVTIVGFLALKKASIASGLMLFLLLITILWTIYIRQKHFMVTNFLPGCDCIHTDRKNNVDGHMDMKFLTESNQYLQPELRDKALYPTNASLQRQLKHGIIEAPFHENAVAVKGGNSTMEIRTSNV